MAKDDLIPAGQPLEEPNEASDVTPEPTEERVFADKFKSADDLESAYVDLNSKLGSQGSELSELRAQNELLQKQVSEFGTQQPAETTTPASPDYDKQLADLTKQYDNADLTTAQYQQGVRDITRQQVLDEVRPQIDEVTNSLKGEFEQRLQERDQAKVIDQFHKENPDFQQLIDSGELDKIKSASPLHDDLSAYYAYKAEQAAKEGELRAAKIEEGKEPAKATLADAGSQASQKPNKPKLTGRALEESMVQSALSAG